MSDPTVKEVAEAVNELQKTLESKNFDVLDSLDKEKIDKINETLNKHEEKNQKLVADLESAKTAAEEYKERLHALELDMARGGPQSQGKNYKESEEYKALETFVKGGKEALYDNAEYKAILRTDNDAQGGYLVPEEMDNVITKKITEVSNIRAIARVRTVSAKSLNMPKRDTIPSAAYEGEAEEGTESNSTYDSETLTPFRQTFTTPITMDMLMDAAFDMESEMGQDAAEAFAKGEGAGFVSGSGFKDPEGFLTNSETVANARTSTTSATVDPEDVILLTGDLKVGYDPVYVFNRGTLAFIRTLKSTTGSFLWQPGLNGPVANTINGFPYLIAQDMPDIASNSLSIAFGDFRRGYTIIDRTGMAVVRDDLTQKKKAIVEFTWHRWNTGQVTLPEAIKLLKTKA